MVSDSAENPEILLEDITATVVRFMQNEKSFSGTPAELAEKLSKYTDEEISPIVLSKRLNQNPRNSKSLELPISQNGATESG